MGGKHKQAQRTKNNARVSVINITEPGILNINMLNAQNVLCVPAVAVFNLRSVLF
jgi:hypothetical protein